MCICEQVDHESLAFLLRSGIERGRSNSNASGQDMQHDTTSRCSEAIPRPLAILRAHAKVPMERNDLRQSDIALDSYVGEYGAYEVAACR